MRRETKGWSGFVGLLALAWVASLVGCISVDRRGGVLTPTVRLDVPAEGSENIFIPGMKIDVLAHVLVPEGLGPYPEVYLIWCRWIGETIRTCSSLSESGVEYSVRMDVTIYDNGLHVATFEGWPPDDIVLEPGEYEMWVSLRRTFIVDGRNYGDSGHAYFEVPEAAEETVLHHGGPEEGTPIPLPEITTQVPSPTALPLTATPTEVPCYRATFIADVTVPDGTILGPTDVVTKTWRLRNAGSCSWPAGTYPVFVSGEDLRAPIDRPEAEVWGIPNPVLPGEVVDVSVDITPLGRGAGEYQANFMLRTPNGEKFGLGPSGDQPFWVRIRVLPPTPVDTEGPWLGSLSVVPQQEIIVPPCEPNVLTFTLTGVTDPSGVQQVVLYWRVVDGAREGIWVAYPMQLVAQQNGVHTFRVDLAWEDLQVSLAEPYSYNGGRVQYYAQAADGVGNVRSTPMGEPIQIFSQCVQ